jgi:hypothetical protein
MMEDAAVTEPKKESPSGSPPLTWQMSACLDVLNDIQEQIRFADSKAGFIAAFNVLLFGFVASHLDKLRTMCAGKEMATGCVVFALLLVGAYVVSTVITLALVVSCVLSRFGGQGRKTRMFFAHIAAQYGKNQDRYAKELGAMTCAQWLEELAFQVVEVSRLAVLKHRRVRWAACFTLCSVLLWVASLTAMVSIFWMRA